MRLFGSVLLVLTIVFPNIARQSGAVLNGTVVDDAGMGVRGVEVELEFVQTGETVTVLTDVLGNYVFEGLPPGVYRLGTDPPDSIPLRIENIDVGPNDTRTFRMTAMPPREPDEEGDLSIRGTVLFAGSGVAVPGAGVRVLGPGSSITERLIGGIREATADSEGRFVFEELGSGLYQLMAAHPSATAGGYTSMLNLTPGPSPEVRLLVPRYAELSGRVTDTNGDPVPDVRVEALAMVWRGGERVVERSFASGTGITDSEGSYSLSAQAGEYYLRAMSRGTELSFAPRYYPDAAYPELAIPITVGADLRRGGLDLRVGEGAASHRVVFRADAASLLASLPEPLSAYVDDEVARFEVWVRPLGLGTIGLSPFRAPVTALGDGEWALPPLPAGEYEIQIGYSDALMDRVGELVLSLDWAVRNPIVRVRVAVEDAEVDLGAIVGAPRIRVSGRLVIRSEAEDALAPQDLRQRLSVVDADFAAATSARVVEPDEDGVFALDLYPGRFVLSASLESYSETWYVASAFSGSTDLLRDHLVAGGSVAPVEIVLADGAGRLDGVVRSEDRDLVPDARVVLVPLPGERGAITQFPSAVADLTGAFSLGRIPPGEYRVLAIDESGRIGSEAYWQDPVFLRQYELRGERVTVDPGARMTIDPEAILLEK